MAAQERFIWLDALRLAAGLSMVGLHATADASGGAWAAYPVSDRILPLLLRAVLYTARTELFLIISVFLLLMTLDRRPRSYGETIREQARRLLPPFLFWTVFYAFYSLIKADAFGYLPARLDALASPAAWGGYLLLGSVKYHMHFIPTLFGLLLFYPLFRLAVRYPALGAMVLACLMVRHELDRFIYAAFHGSEALPFLARGVKILTYAGYGLAAAAALGVWRRIQAGGADEGGMAGADRRWLPLVLYTGLLLFLIKLVATRKTIETGAWPFLYTPGYWADFLMPLVLFAVCMLLGHRRWPPVLSRLAPYSFGIYLCHPIFLDLAEIGLHGLQWPPVAQVWVKICTTIALTSALVALIARIPALAWTIGLGPLPRLSGPGHARSGVPDAH